MSEKEVSIDSEAGYNENNSGFIDEIKELSKSNELKYMAYN